MTAYVPYQNFREPKPTIPPSDILMNRFVKRREDEIDQNRICGNRDPVRYVSCDGESRHHAQPGENAEEP
jgi:hypothetical protein